MDTTRLRDLTIAYLTDTITEAEGIEFARLLQIPENQDLFQELIHSQLQSGLLDLDEPSSRTLERIQQSLAEKIKENTEDNVVGIHRRRSLQRHWLRYAAAVICLLAAGTYLWFRNMEQPAKSTAGTIPEEIVPGKQGAVVTLADGSEVVLDSLGNGIVASENGAQVVLKDGQLTYDPTGITENKIVYNTTRTPRGRQFKLQLPDGTMVWLNAASSLRYPTTFGGADRRVEITGEAYFEVARNPRQPFFVKINDQAEVEVLGTSFNVNAYKEEASINTTLIDGSIRASVVPDAKQGNAESAVLKPGQQARIMNLLADASKSSIKIVNNADFDKVLAWKNGLFNFQDKSFEEVMRLLERWYDIEVVYEQGVPDIQFVGEMSRDVSFEGLIRVLKESEVHFRLEDGKRLIIMP